MDEMQRQRLLQMKEQLLAEKQRRQTASRPSVDELYEQEQEAIDNRPYISPEQNAVLEQSLTDLRRSGATGPTPRPQSVSTVQQQTAVAPPQQQGGGALDTLTDIGSALNPVAGVGVKLADMATPYVKEAADFYQRNVGAPLADAIFDADPMSRLTKGTALEPLRRHVVAPLAGEDWANKSTSPQGEAALRSGVAALPGVGKDSAFSPSVDTMVGVAKGGAQSVLPSVATAGVSGAVGATSKLGPMVTRLLGLAVEGAVGGGIEGLLIKSQDPKTSAVMGAVAGPLMDLGIQGVGKAVTGARRLFSKGAAAAPTPVPKVEIAKVEPHVAPALDDELGALADTAVKRVPTVEKLGPKAELTPGEAGRLHGEMESPSPAVERVANLKEVTPFKVVLDVDGEGKAVARVFEVRVDGKVKMFETSIAKSADREVIYKLLSDNDGLSLGSTSRSAADINVTDFWGEWTRQQYVDPKGWAGDFFPEKKFIGDGFPAPNRIDPEGYAKYHGVDHPSGGKVLNASNKVIEETPTGSMRRPKRDSQKTGVAPPDPDAPVIAPTKTSRVLSDGKHLTTRDTFVGASPEGGTKITPVGFRPDAPHPLESGANSTRIFQSNPEPPDAGAGKGGRTGPPPPPAPPPPPGPGDMNPSDIEAIGSVLAAAEKMSRTPSLFDRAMRQLVGSHLRGPKDAGQLILMQRSQAALIETTKDIHNRMRSLVSAKEWAPLGREVLKYAQGAQNAHVLEHKFPKVWGTIKAEVDTLLQERDMYHRIITELGGVPDDLTDLMESGAIDKYVARDYLAHILGPGVWAKHVRKYKPEVMEDAVRHLTKDMEGWSPDDIAAQLLRIMNAADPLDAYRGSPLAQSKGAKALLKRGDIPEPIRKLMGEVDNGFDRIARSLGSQRAIASNLTMWREIAGNQTMFSKVARRDLHPDPLPNSRRHFGDAAGGYVTPHLYDALVTVPQTIENGWRLLNPIVKWGKFNEVAAGGMTPWINATVGNLWYSMLAGGLDWSRPLASGKAFVTARNALVNYGKTAKDSLVLEAKRMGVDGRGVGGMEMASGRGMIDDLLGDVTPDMRLTIHDVFDRLGKGLYRGTTKSKDWLSHQYDLIDRTFKLANYVAVRDKLIAQGMDPEMARRQAAMRVNQSFTSPDKMGPLVQKAVHGPAGLVARYGTFFAEDLRINLSLPKRLMEEPDLRARVLGWGLIGGGLFGAGGVARRQLGGISDEEVAKVEAAQSEGKKFFRPLTWCLPWRDSRGHPQLVDLTQWFPLGRLLQGHPDDAMWRRVLSNLILGPVEGGLGEGAMREFLASTGLIKSQARMKDPLQHEPKVLQVMQKLWDVGMAPKGPERMYESLRRGEAFGPNSQLTESFAPETAAAKAAGLPMLGGVTPTQTGPSALQSAVETKAQLNELKAQLIRAAAMDPKQSVPFLKAVYQSATGETNASMKQAKMQMIQATMKSVANKHLQRQQTLGGRK